MSTFCWALFSGIDPWSFGRSGTCLLSTKMGIYISGLTVTLSFEEKKRKKGKEDLVVKSSMATTWLDDLLWRTMALGGGQNGGSGSQPARGLCNVWNACKQLARGSIHRCTPGLATCKEKDVSPYSDDGLVILCLLVATLCCPPDLRRHQSVQQGN